jgi:DNA (cytosine-5)-methyltransferase 1
MNTNFNNIGQTTEKPLSVITANRKWHYLVNPSWGGNTGSIDKPCCVVVARQDKAPLYLITTNLGSVSVPIYDDDSPMVIEVKKVMALLGITDIKMRMLSINELKLITGFSKDYKLVGTQTDQKKFIGNAVPTQISKAITESLAEFIIGSNLSPSVRFEDKIPLLKTA